MIRILSSLFLPTVLSLSILGCGDEDKPADIGVDTATTEDTSDTIDTNTVDTSDTDTVDTDTVDTGDTDTVDTGDTDPVDTADTSDTDTDSIGPGPNAVVDFSLPDTNPSSPTVGQTVSPRDYLQQISGWYFIKAT
jgi:hypothetical protein